MKHTILVEYEVDIEPGREVIDLVKFHDSVIIKRVMVDGKEYQDGAEIPLKGNPGLNVESPIA